jgi:single-strand DNA-binding protein
MNKFYGVGNLGRDPDVRTMQDGKVVVNFSFASTEKYVDKKGEQQSITEWINVVAFGRVAEICVNQLKKGTMVFVEGKMKTEKYDKDGRTIYSTKIVAAQVHPISDKKTLSKDAAQHDEEKRNGYIVEQDAEFDDAIPF